MNQLVEINGQIMSTLLELLKQGGPMALWGMAIWLTVGLIRLIVICSMVYLVTRTVKATVLGVYKAKLDFKASQISVLTTQVSTHLSQTLEDYHKSVTAILNSIDEHLKLLKEKSKQ